MLRTLWLLCLFAISLPAQAAERPNVIVIFTDDQGSIDVNCYGAKDLTTPHLNDLAKRGLRFTQFYSAAPVCSPSRAGLLTGRFPQRAGLAGNASSSQGGHGLPSEQITIAEMMRKAGYATGHVGKWHLGYVPEEMPLGQGFQQSFGHMGGCIDNYSHFFYWNGPNRHDLWRNGKEVWHDGEFFPDLMVHEACKFIEAHQDEPFFLYWALNTPHYPLQGEEKWRKHYQDLPSPRDKYAAFVSTTDEKIGQVLAKLEELKLRENTIVIFQSDHGHSTEARTFGGGGNSGPYRGAKFSLFEGGIRVPAMISWPGKIPAGEVRTQMATGCDWFPTIAELCELPQPEHRIDGKSLTEVLHSPESPSPHEMFFWESGRSRDGPRWAVRQGDWKLLGHPLDNGSHSSNSAKSKPAPLYLVNLAEDPSEQTNLAEQHPQVVQRLEAAYKAWRKDTNP